MLLYIFSYCFSPGQRKLCLLVPLFNVYTKLPLLLKVPLFKLLTVGYLSNFCELCKRLSYSLLMLHFAIKFLP